MTIYVRISKSVVIIPVSNVMLFSTHIGGSFATCTVIPVNYMVQQDISIVQVVADSTTLTNSSSLIPLVDKTAWVFMQLIRKNGFEQQEGPLLLSFSSCWHLRRYLVDVSKSPWNVLCLELNVSHRGVLLLADKTFSNFVYYAWN